MTAREAGRQFLPHRLRDVSRNDAENGRFDVESATFQAGRYAGGVTLCDGVVNHDAGVRFRR
jgi:hypothetical protein